MNRSALKKYAPQARLDFIEAVSLRARRLGLDPELPVSVEQTGDVLLIAGQPFPVSVAKQRTALAQRIQQQGFSAVVEALAYTWFNRFVAIRFMELKGYLSHGYRVLSHPEGQLPEILEHAHHLDLPGLDKEEVIRLKTAGNQDEALYREILLAQCHELHRYMPFLFEALDDATELLLPDNLLRTDSPIAHLVSDIEEADWQEVEVIGWLYQFYISDKKDEVIGKVVKSEDIPAATQLFTPNWIVQYLVQNSLGRLWLMANPGSNLKDKMPYYIEPAEQTPGGQAQLNALIKVRIDEDGGTLNPESLTVLDPACGSGHILVEAYNLLRAIYEERSYRLRDIPRLILQKNLYGLDIDDRAAQLAGFALLMKAREDDRRLFDEEDNPPQLNVMAIQQSTGLPDEEIAQVILNAAIQIEGGDAFHSGQLFGGGQLETQHSSGLTALDLRQLIQLFEHGKTFGSLISLPKALNAKLGNIVDLLASVRSQGDDLSRSYANQVLEQFAWPASLLALQYDAVVANPPYMGSKGMNAFLKSFAQRSFPDSKADLFAMFMERGFMLCRSNGFNSMVTMQSWMFLSSYQSMREKILTDRAIIAMAHLGARAFSEISGEIVQTTAFVLGKTNITKARPVFNRLIEGSEQEKQDLLLASGQRFDGTCQYDFSKVPGSPLAYWIDDNTRDVFVRNPNVASVAHCIQGIITGDTQRYIRLWPEISFSKIALGADDFSQVDLSSVFWIPYTKGGQPRKWYGNNEYVINWKDEGRGLVRARTQNSDFYLKPCVTWTLIGSSAFAARYCPPGFLWDVSGSIGFPKNTDDLKLILAILCSRFSKLAINILNPTINTNIEDVDSIPICVPSLDNRSAINDLVQRAIDISTEDWDLNEMSWGFRYPFELGGRSLSDSWLSFKSSCEAKVRGLECLEREIESLLVTSYKVDQSLIQQVESDQVSLKTASREDDAVRLVSYAVGCMNGRYSLDEPGLIYAHSGSIGFDVSRYTKFPADADGIIPVTDESWFADDATERMREFVKVVWGGDTIVENMEWLADSLGRKSGESADETVRRYLSTSFYKDHLQTYKKRPIYWLFSSGKQKAFECLVYLHRYNEGTLSRMRMEYVVPLQSRMQARIDKLTDDIDSATSSAQQKALQKRKDKLTKQLEELRRFDENLRPYADQRITLDLDDGVKVNYGKFGNLLAEVKAVTGGKEE